MYCALGVRTSAQSLVFLFCRFNASLPFKVSSAWIYSWSICYFPTYVCMRGETLKMKNIRMFCRCFDSLSLDGFFAFLNWTKHSRPKLPSKYNQQLTFLIDFRNSLTCASVYICLVCRESCKLSEFVLWWFLSTFKLCCQFAAVRIMDFLRNHRVNKLLNTYKSNILFNSKH